MNVEAVISSRSADNDSSPWMDELVTPTPSQTSHYESQMAHDEDVTVTFNPDYHSDVDSDEEFIGYLAKKAGIDATTSYFADEQYWPGKHLLHRYARRKRTKAREPPLPNDTDDPAYSTYIVSGSVDLRLEASFELLAEKDMQLAWKEEYRDTLHFVASCGSASLPLHASKAAEATTGDPFTVLAGLKASQALLCSVLVQLAGSCSDPFSELSPVALIRLWWGVTHTQLTLSKDKDKPSRAVYQHLFLLDHYLQLQSDGGQNGVDDSKPAADPSEVTSLSQLTCHLGFLPHIVRLINNSPSDADSLMQGLKLVTAILSAQMVLSVRYGAVPPNDGSCGGDLEPLGFTLTGLLRRRSSHGQLQIIEEFVDQLLKYYKEAPAVEEKEGSMKMLTCSGMLIVVERTAHFLCSTE